MTYQDSNQGYQMLPEVHQHYYSSNEVQPSFYPSPYIEQSNRTQFHQNTYNIHEGYMPTNFPPQEYMHHQDIYANSYYQHSPVQTMTPIYEERVVVKKRKSNNRNDSNFKSQVFQSLSEEKYLGNDEKKKDNKEQDSKRSQFTEENAQYHLIRNILFSMKDMLELDRYMENDFRYNITDNNGYLLLNPE